VGGKTPQKIKVSHGIMGRNIQPWWGKNSIENKGKSWNYGKEYPTLVGEKLHRK
jgi:hypothetical protein